MVGFREGHRVEAGVGCNLPRGEAYVAHGHGQGLAATALGNQQCLLGDLAQSSEDRHVDVGSAADKEKEVQRFRSHSVLNIKRSQRHFMWLYCNDLCMDLLHIYCAKNRMRKFNTFGRQDHF